MSEATKKILHIYRSEPDATTQTLVSILNRDREAKEFKLYLGKPNYDMLVQMIFDADQTVSWW